MSKYSDDYLKNIISKVANKCKLENTRYSINKFDNIGQNYFGVLIPIVLTGNLHGKQKDLHLVMKLAPTDESYRVSGALTLFFSKEIYVYSTLLVAYKKLQEGYLPESQYISPNCYYVCREYCKEVIVMDDMHAQGYKLYLEHFLDYEHVVVSIISLAKLHALSFILKINNQKLFKEVSEVCIPLNEQTNKRFLVILEDRLQKALEKFNGSKYIPLLQDLKSHYGKYIDLMFSAVNGVAVCHGDIWKENILFKYENKKPISSCLIDYQTTRLSSPAFDILFLIITSTETPLRKCHFNDFINKYYATFESILKEANIEAKDVYSKDQFLSDLKICAPASFIIANTALWLASGLQQEGHVRSKIVCEHDTDNFSATNSYTSLISAIIDDFCSQGYFKL